jgi:serine/threonine protein phosphatase PrpC
MIVADGVGGRSGGAEASELLVQCVAGHFRDTTGEVSDLDCVSLLERIDRILWEDRLAGETTAVLAVVTPEAIVGASVGDSDAYLILPDREYALTHNRRKPYLGYGAAAAEPFNAELGDGVLLLASDGLWKYADLGRVLSIARTPSLSLEAMAAALIDAARLPNGALWDDVSVALCRRSHA